MICEKYKIKCFLLYWLQISAHGYSGMLNLTVHFFFYWNCPLFKSFACFLWHLVLTKWHIAIANSVGLSVYLSVGLSRFCYFRHFPGKLRRWNLAGDRQDQIKLKIENFSRFGHLGGSGGGGAVNSEKKKKWSIFNLRTGDGILMKFDVWKDIVSQSSYFRSWPDPVTLGELESGNLKSWKTLRVEWSGWNLMGK